VHLFWGAPDLAVTRFSGRRAPPHPGGVRNLPDWVAREAYSHEVSSCGFWPGGGATPYPAFYAYAYLEPAGFTAAKVAAAIRPRARSPSPDETLLVVQSSYDAAADLGNWDHTALERVRASHCSILVAFRSASQRFVTQRPASSAPSRVVTRSKRAAPTPRRDSDHETAIEGSA
jgi:hypothetical protein